jgi:hypothetical protein
VGPREALVRCLPQPRAPWARCSADLGPYDCSNVCGPPFVSSIPALWQRVFFSRPLSFAWRTTRASVSKQLTREQVHA